MGGIAPEDIGKSVKVPREWVEGETVARAKCNRCGNRMALQADGTFPEHGVLFAGKCAGSNQKPATQPKGTP